jgi:ADP-ribose pyrophosphatase YjhB (NUDIX family)
MITFEKDNIVFLYRVGGIAVHENKVLLNKGEHGDFWWIPVGRCEFLETTKEALLKEIDEELNVRIEIDRLLYVIENFFILDGKNHHEIGLYYLIRFPEEFYLNTMNSIFLGHEGEKKLICQWFEINDLENVRLFPSILRKKLKNIKGIPEHVIQVDHNSKEK